MPAHPEDAGTDSAGAGHYFASADYQTLYRQFGITAAAARDSIRDARTGPGLEATLSPLPRPAAGILA